MVKKVTTDLDSSRAGPDSIPVVVLKNCDSERSYILAEFFNMCVKESCLSDCSHCWSLYLRMLKGLQVKAIALVVFCG